MKNEVGHYTHLKDIISNYNSLMDIPIKYLFKAKFVSLPLLCTSVLSGRWTLEHIVIYLKININVT